MVIRELVRKTSGHLLDLLYPRNCLGCGEAVGDASFRYICSACEKDLWPVQQPHCLTCGYPFFGHVFSERSCPHCQELEPLFDEGRTVMLSRGVGRELIHTLKYNAGVFLLPDIQTLIRRAYGLDQYLRDSILVPVPLHPAKLRDRGFNQSEILARYFCDTADGALVRKVLNRVVNTPTQTNLDRSERIKNMKNAFAISPNTVLDPQLCHILIDDVFTTGSTLNACCTELKKAGIRQIKILTLGHG